MLKRERQRRLLGRREEAQRDPADGAARAEAGVLDETDSGLDIDALRSSPRASTRCARPERAMLVITHYQRLLDYIVPDVVHVLQGGRIVKTGGKELALELDCDHSSTTPRRRERWQTLNRPASMTAIQSTPAAKQTDPFLKAFERFEQAGASAQPSWLFPLRKAGIARFAELGFPTLKHEDWRFTNVAPIAKLAFKPVLDATAVGSHARLHWRSFRSRNCPAPGSSS
jgi:ABC-type glutathione transport system ATPase component